MTTFEKIILGIGLYVAFSSNSDQEDEAAIGKMNTHRFIPVFRETPNFDTPNKYNLKHTKNKSGVYIIKENGIIRYIGYSYTNNLYKTISRHFQEWNAKQTVISYAGDKVRYRYTIRVVFTSPTKAKKLERALLLKYRPRDNAEILNLLDKEEAEAAQIEKENKIVIEEYDNTEKFDYPPDWDNF